MTEPVLDVLEFGSSTEAYKLEPQCNCFRLEGFSAGRRAVSRASSFEPNTSFTDAIKKVEPLPEDYVTQDHVEICLSEGPVYIPIANQVMYDIAKLYGLPSTGTLFPYKVGQESIEDMVARKILGDRAKDKDRRIGLGLFNGNDLYASIKLVEEGLVRFQIKREKFDGASELGDSYLVEDVGKERKYIPCDGSSEKFLQLRVNDEGNLDLQVVTKLQKIANDLGVALDDIKEVSEVNALAKPLHLLKTVFSSGAIEIHNTGVFLPEVKGDKIAISDVSVNNQQIRLAYAHGTQEKNFLNEGPALIVYSAKGEAKIDTYMLDGEVGGDYLKDGSKKGRYGKDIVHFRDSESKEYTVVAIPNENPEQKASFVVLEGEIKLKDVAKELKRKLFKQ